MEDTLATSQVLDQTLDRTSPDAGPAASQAGAHGADASQPRWGSHPVNIRFTVPLLIRSYYVTIVVGPERRSRERRAVERKKHPLLTFWNVIVYLVAGAGWLIFLSTIYHLVSLGV